MSTQTGDYRAEREADVVLRSGSTVHVRPVRADDAEALRAFLDGVSTRVDLAALLAMASRSWVVASALDVDYADRFGAVVETASIGSATRNATSARSESMRE